MVYFDRELIAVGMWPMVQIPSLAIDATWEESRENV